MLVRWAIRRYMDLLPVWLQVVLVGMVVVWLGWGMLFDTSKSGSLSGYNHTDRPLGRYFVNGNYGGNGGTTCCWSFKGDTAEVVWILSVTGEQKRQGLEQERHSVTLPMPDYSQEDRRLHVHFLPGNKVELAWSPDLQSPLSDRIQEELAPQ